MVRQLHLVVANSADWCRCQALILDKPLETSLPLARDGEDMVDLAERLFYLPIRALGMRASIDLDSFVPLLILPPGDAFFLLLACCTFILRQYLRKVHYCN